MRSYKIIATLASILASSLLVATQPQTIQQVFDSFAQTGTHPYGHSKVQELANKLNIRFDDAKNYTIFAPYNYAIPDDTSSITADFVKYHMTNQLIRPSSSAGQVLIDTLLVGTGGDAGVTNLPAGTAQRLVLNYTNDPNVTILYYGQDNTTQTDYVIECTNGYIYFVLSLLKVPLKPSAALQSNQKIGDLSAIGNDLKSATYNGQSDSDLLDNATGMTFFAVDNAAFASLSSSSNKNNVKLTNRTILYATQSLNVIAYSDYLATHSVLVNALGETLNVTVNNGVYYVDNVPVTYANIPTWNGVIHVVAHFFDETVNRTKNNTNGTTPISNNNITDINNNTSAAISLFGNAAVASILAVISTSALFFVFSL